MKFLDEQPDEVSSADVRDGEIVALYLKWSGKVLGYPCGARLLALAQERGRLTAELSELHQIPSSAAACADCPVLGIAGASQRNT